MNNEGLEGQGDISAGTPGQPPQSSHALQDHMMQLTLLEQQNKRRLFMARQKQEQDNSAVTEPLDAVYNKHN